MNDIVKRDKNKFRVQYSATTKESFANNLIGVMLRVLPDFKGSWLIYRHIIHLFPKKLRTTRLEVSKNGKPLLAVDFDILDPPQFTMVKKRRYDLGTALTIYSLLRESDTFFDVGANSGYISAVAAQKVGDSGLVVSIEPNKEAFHSLLERKLSNSVALNHVCSDVSGKSFQLKKAFYRQTTSSYFVEGEGVSSITLDAVYNQLNKPSVRLVKVDAEGAELQIVKGARQLLAERDPYVIIEAEEDHAERYGYSLMDLKRFMNEMGYSKYYFIDDSKAFVESLEDIKEGQILFSKEALTSHSFSL